MLFTANSGIGGNFDAADIPLLSLKTGRWKTVLRGASFGRYLRGGHLLYIHQGTLFGVRFDPVRGEIHGMARPLLEQVSGTPNDGGSGQLDVSQTGTLGYVRRESDSVSHRIASLDSGGNLRPLLDKPDDYVAAPLSPDGSQLAIVMGGDISVYNFQRGTMGQDHVYGEHGPTGLDAGWEAHRLFNASRQLRTFVDPC